MRVLIIRLSALGDIVHGLPAAALLKDRLPDLELSWLVEPAGVPLLAGNPVVDRVIVFPAKQWRKQLRSVSGIGATAAEAGSFVGALRERHFDAILDLQGLCKSALPGFLSGANLRFGFKGTREGAERLLTHPLDVGDYFGFNTHVVDLNLRLAGHACRILLAQASDTESSARGNNSSYIYDSPRFPLPAPPAETLAATRELLTRGAQKPSSPLIAFIPGTTWETKIWPADKWTRLAELCLERSPGHLILLGGAAEIEMNARIAEKLGEKIIDLTGKTSINDLLAIFSQTDIVVGADTGPLHLAAAVGKAKTVAIFGSTPALRNGPYGSHCLSLALNLDCQPCFKNNCPLGTISCLRDLSPDYVFEQIIKFTGLT